MPISAEADRRIRRFTVGVGLVAALIGIMTVASLVVPSGLFTRGSDYPWLAADPTEAERDGDIWSAPGSGLVVLPDELRERPISIELLSDGDGISVHLGDEGDREASPHYEGSAWTDSPLPIAAYAQSELWIVAEQPWRARIREIVPPELDQSTTGSGDRVFVYRGTASSGTLSWSGEGGLYVIAHTVEGYESLGSEYVDEPGSRRFVWQESPFVVIEVMARDDVVWTIELDSVPGSTPSPSETPAPETSSPETEGGDS